MKINMRPHWIQIGDLSEEKQKEVWEVVQKIKNILDLRRPRNIITISLNSNPDEKEATLRELKDQEELLKINEINRIGNFASVTINLKKFDAFYKKLENIESPKKGISNNLIKEIICVKPKLGDRFTVIVNNDYTKLIRGDRAKNSWKSLFEVAEKKEIWYEPEYKSYLDYFNSNELNRLYTQTGCKIIKIFKKEGDYIYPNIKMSVIS